MRTLRRWRPEAAPPARRPQRADLYFRRVRRSSVRRGALRAAAWGVVAAGVAAPLVRKRLSAPPIAVQAVAFAAPFGLCVAVRRSRTRDVTVCALQMWAYLAAYKSPHDDPAAQERRVHVDYPILADRILGFGELPSLRLQRALAREPAPGVALGCARSRARVGALDVVHGAPRNDHLHPRARPRAVPARSRDDLRGVRHRRRASTGWLPTAPPWYAASLAADRGDGKPAVRRMMVEYGELFWRDGWGSLYSVFGGNPLAAMPSLHFATSVMAALLLAEVGPVAGALGFSYAAALGFALVYLGEHYVVDLLAGAALTGPCGVWSRVPGRPWSSWGAPSAHWRRWPTRRADLGVKRNRIRHGQGWAMTEDAVGEPPAPVARAARPAEQPDRHERHAHEEEMPRVSVTRRRAVGFALFILAGVAFLYFVLPRLAGVGTEVHHLEHGDKWWIAIGVLLELLSFGGYIVLFRAVFLSADSRIGWPESYQITMAGLAATRLFAAGGAGGVALTAWALRRSGMEPRLVAVRMVAFLVLLYAIYAGAVVIDGIGLGTGLFPGGGSFAITFVPAIVAAVLVAAVGAMALLPGRHRATPGTLGVGLRAPRASGGQRRDGARACGQRRTHGDPADPRTRSRAAGRRRLVGL